MCPSPVITPGAKLNVNAAACHQAFEFDHSFGEGDDTKEVYDYVALPLVRPHTYLDASGSCTLVNLTDLAPYASAGSVYPGRWASNVLRVRPDWQRKDPHHGNSG